MADYTKNYNLKKPSPEDFVDIADINGNMDKIDEALQECKDSLLSKEDKERLDTLLNPADEDILFAVPGEDGDNAIEVKKDKETVIRNNLNVGEDNLVYGKGAVVEGRKSIAVPGTLYNIISSDIENNQITLENPLSANEIGRKVILHATSAARIPVEVEILGIDETGQIVTVSELAYSYNKLLLPTTISTSSFNYTAHAEGSKTIACGITGSHAEGRRTIASGINAHAENFATEARGSYSHAEGYYTKANGGYQHVQGKYNIEDTESKYADIVGNGSSESSRSNAYTLDWNGNGWYAGDVESAVGGKLSEKADKIYVDSAVANLGQAGIKFTNVTIGGKMQKASSPSVLSESRSEPATTSIGNYALFGGGGGSSSVVDVYNTSLSRSTPTPLSVGRSELASTTVGNYALFAGGYASAASAVVDAYNASLSRSTPAPLATAKRSMLGGTIGNYALFAGGSATTIDAYNTSLTKITVTDLSRMASNSSAVTAVGNYVLFNSSYYNSGPWYTQVDAYNTSVTKTLLDAYEAGWSESAATTIGGYALFAGGYHQSSIFTANIYVYDAGLTRTMPTQLSKAREFMGATTVGGFALFAGGSSGRGSATTYYDVVDIYNENLTKSVGSSLKEKRNHLVGGTVGSYALFAYSDGTFDTYKEIVAELAIPAFSKYYFTGVTTSEQTTIKGRTITSSIPLTGYIKKITELSGMITAN